MSVDCDVQWDGDCESGWAGIGAANTLEVLHYEHAPFSVIAIEPGTRTANGIRRAFDVSLESDIQIAFPAFRLGGNTGDTVDVKLQLLFITSTGVVLESHEVIETVDDVTALEMTRTVPVGAVDAVISVLAESASAAGVFAATGLAINEQSFGWTVTPTANADCGGEYTVTVDSSCYTSCPPGTQKKSMAIPDGPCIDVTYCWCEDLATGGTNGLDFKDKGNWAN